MSPPIHQHNFDLQGPVLGRSLLLLTGVFFSSAGPSHSFAEEAIHSDHSLGLSDEVIPFESFGEDLTRRPRTLTEVIDDTVYPENLERDAMLRARATDDVETEVPERRSLFGSDRFLSSGPIDPGVVLPTGATWRPSFLLFGSYRTALQSYEAAGDPGRTEWANRLDLFGNLYLSSTERFLFGFRPLDEEGAFTGVAAGQGIDTDFVNGLNFEPTLFFFEGDFGEIFPNLDPEDTRHLDFGFSIGRQRLVLQDGILANDHLDLFGATRHNLFQMGASTSRLSGFFGFNELHRNNRVRDSRGRLIALSSHFDYPERTIEADLVYVNGSDSLGGDGAYLGLGHRAQVGYWHATTRINASFALDDTQILPALRGVDDGWLLTHQMSRVMPYNEDVLTFSAFAEFGDFTSAARDPAVGGPLGGFSMLQRAVEIGTYGAPIPDDGGDLFGLEVAYQHFLDGAHRRQIMAAIGGVGEHGSSQRDATFATSLTYQQALSDHLLWIVSGFGSTTDEGNKGFGLRTELQRKF
ncbi:MAG: hypothetical protein AAGA96_16140 [Verrucomicrobiota bacterium]